MADEADCPVCEGNNPVSWIITHFNPAATMRSCEVDFEAAILALLATRLEVEPGWLSEVINTAIDAENEVSAAAEAAPDEDENVGTFGPDDEVGPDDLALRDLTPEKFARKYGTDDDNQADDDD